MLNKLDSLVRDLELLLHQKTLTSLTTSRLKVPSVFGDWDTEVGEAGADGEVGDDTVVGEAGADGDIADPMEDGDGEDIMDGKK